MDDRPPPFHSSCPDSGAHSGMNISCAEEVQPESHIIIIFFGDTKGDGLSFISYLSHMVTEAIKISSNLEPKYLAHYTHSFRLGVQVSLFMGFITTGLGVFCLCFLKGGRSKFSEWPVVIGACSHDDNNQVSYLPQKTGTHAGL